MLGIEQRGHDAAGYAFVSVKDRQVHLAKAPVTASKFIQTEGHILNKPDIQAMPKQMIIHTRAWTKGHPKENQNNHPIFSKATGLCLVHNGWIVNDDELVEEHKLVTDAEVDTEVYLRMIDKYYLANQRHSIPHALKAATKQVYGSLACGMLQSGNPNSLWLWRGSGALFVAATDWGWIFSSTQSCGIPALLSSMTAFDCGTWQELSLPIDTLLSIHSSGKWGISKLETPDWKDLPSQFNSRVTKVWTNGKVSQVRRYNPNNRGSVTHTSGYSEHLSEHAGGHALDEYYGGYGLDAEEWHEYWNQRRAERNGTVDSNGCSTPTATSTSEPSLPDVHYRGTSTTHELSSTPPEGTKEAEATWTAAEQAQIEKERPFSCACGHEYWCWQCRTKYTPILRRYGKTFEEVKTFKIS